MSRCSFSPTKTFLLLLVVIQWILLLILLHRQQIHVNPFSSTTLPTSSTGVVPLQHQGPPNHPTTITTTRASPPEIKGSVVQGVAATLMFKAPQWFHLRYTAMLQNALANVPETWKVQIIYNPQWFEKDVLPWHPKIKLWLTQGHERIVFTAIPDFILSPHMGGKQDLKKNKRSAVKPKHVSSHRWFWQSLVAEQVLMFSGNGALCGNHFNHDNMMTFDHWMNSTDFVGTPSTRNNGYGGDGSSHSFRKKSVMLRVIDYAEKHQMDIGNDSEHGWTLRVIEKMRKDKMEKDPPIRLATPEQTNVFGAVTNLTNEAGILHIPMVVAGTHAQLTYDDRETLLKHCPEVKLIFPSLHEPACFGAHPQPQQCRASICALQDELPRSGC